MSIANATILESGNLVQALPPTANPSGVTPIYCDLSNYNRVSVIISGVNDGTGAASAVTIVQAKTEAGGSSKALALPSYYANTDVVANGAVFTLTTAVSNTFSTVVTASKQYQYVIEIQGSALDVNNGFQYMAVTFANNSHTTVDIQYYLRDARYAQTTPPAATT